MYLDERPASELGLAGSRDVIVWRCRRPGCGRYFEGAVGYRDARSGGRIANSTPRCPNDGAFLVAQQALEAYICPVARCATVHARDTAGAHNERFAVKFAG